MFPLTEVCPWQVPFPINMSVETSIAISLNLASMLWLSDSRGFPGLDEALVGRFNDDPFLVAFTYFLPVSGAGVRHRLGSEVNR